LVLVGKYVSKHDYQPTAQNLGNTGYEGVTGMMQERTLISALSFHLLSLSSHMVHKHHVIIFHVRGLFKFGSKYGENVSTLSFHAVRVFLFLRNDEVKWL
jgi:hypothetical protein